MSLATDLLKMAAARQPLSVTDTPPRPIRKRVERNGIPRGIYRRPHGRWHARDIRGSEYRHLGMYGTIREACEALARYLQCEVLDLPGITEEFWNSVKDQAPKGPSYRFKRQDEVLPLSRIKQLLEYRDGEFYWKVSRGNIKKGQIAGNVHNASGDRRIRIERKYYLCARLSWYWHTGEWPQVNVFKVSEHAGTRIENLYLIKDGIEIYGSDLVK